MNPISSLFGGKSASDAPAPATISPAVTDDLSAAITANQAPVSVAVQTPALMSSAAIAPIAPAQLNTTPATTPAVAPAPQPVAPPVMTITPTYDPTPYVPAAPQQAQLAAILSVTGNAPHAADTHVNQVSRPVVTQLSQDVQAQISQADQFVQQDRATIQEQLSGITKQEEELDQLLGNLQALKAELHSKRDQLSAMLNGLPAQA